MQEYIQTARGFLGSIRERKDNFVRTAQDILQESDRRISNQYKALQSERNSSAGMRSADVMKAIREEERRRWKQFVEPTDIALEPTRLMPAIPKSTESGTTDKMVAQVLTPQVDVQEPAKEPIEEPQVDEQEPDEDELTQRRPAMSRPQQKDALFFEVRDPQELKTLKLAEEAVNLCIVETGRYPSAIILSHSRYAAMSSAMRATEGFYITEDITRIPYKCVKEVVDYDVAAICEV